MKHLESTCSIQFFFWELCCSLINYPDLIDDVGIIKLGHRFRQPYVAPNLEFLFKPRYLYLAFKLEFIVSPIFFHPMMIFTPERSTGVSATVHYYPSKYHLNWSFKRKYLLIKRIECDIKLFNSFDQRIFL